MKTELTTDSIVTVYSAKNILFAIYDPSVDEKIDLKSINIELTISGSNMMVNGQLSPEDWIRSMLHGKLIIDSNVSIEEQYGLGNKFDIMIVGKVDINYILLILLRILQSLNKDESITIDKISYTCN